MLPGEPWRGAQSAFTQLVGLSGGKLIETRDIESGLALESVAGWQTPPAKMAMLPLASAASGAPAGFCIGLLHLIGCLVMARAGAGLANFDNTSNARLAMAQEVSLGIAYPEVGALALQKWEFPPEVHEPIRYQMHPERAGAFVGTAVHLGRAVELAMFIEESRPGSPTYREGAKINAPLGPLARVVEARSTELMESFYTVPPRRPAWATDP